MKIIKIILIFNFLIFFNSLIVFSRDYEEEQSENIIIEKKESVTGDEQNIITAMSLPVKRIFLQIGAIESKDGNKFMLRKKNSKLEFFIEDNVTSVFLKEQADAKNLTNNNFIVIRGHNNKKAILANAIYIYADKELYNNFMDRINITGNKIQEISGNFLETGDLFDKLDENIRPCIINTNNTKMLFFYDDTTYWVVIKKGNRTDINAGDRVILYFDQRVSLRTKNIPFKIVVDRVKIGY